MLKIHYSFSCLVEILPKCIEASHLINLDLLTTLYFLIMVCLDIKVFLNQPLILWLDLAYFLSHTLSHIFILLSLEQACQVQTTLRVAKATNTAEGFSRKSAQKFLSKLHLTKLRG